MSMFMSALEKETNKTVTENGMKAFVSTKDDTLDYFYKVGGSRGKDLSNMVDDMVTAIASKDDLGVLFSLLFFSRDCRGGIGERQHFRNALKVLDRRQVLAGLSDGEKRRFCDMIVKVGRWDDLLCLNPESDFGKFAYGYMCHAVLFDKNGLAAKWCPRKGPVSKALAKMMDKTPKEYRQTIVALSKTVEQQMCARDWDNIEFGKVPSVAHARYMAAFRKHQEVRYDKYLSSVNEGTEKMNAGVVNPYMLVQNPSRPGANEMWNNLPDYFEGTEGCRILPIVDVSGSMTCGYGKSSARPIDVAVSLGLYCAERNRGALKGAIMTFSDNPSLVQLDLKKSLDSKVRQLQRQPWGFSTNLERTFEELLRFAKKNKVPQEDMPEVLCIISDMQFNQAVRGEKNPTALKMVKKQYKEAGYEMPNIIFWNAAAKTENVPVTMNKEGVCLVSGASPALFKDVASGNFRSPWETMMEMIGGERYQFKFDED